MFDRLSQSLQKVFRDVRGYGKLSEANIKDALREIRLALLEADVQVKVVKDFVARVREKSLGADVMESVTPGQQFTKHVHDELVHLLGDERTEPDLTGTPASMMMIGLHGSGKTTTTAKLAAQYKNRGKKVLLAACDIRRPAAVDQLEILGREVGVPVVRPETGDTVAAVGKRALRRARETYMDLVIYDTGGRFQIDEALVAELGELQKAVEPNNVFLVLDAAIGQESVNVAETFHREVGLTGLILTKLDGDARGGAALSVRAVTGCPVLWAGMGEKVADLEPFHPGRMASRILGMGDVVSLVEKAQEAFEPGDIDEMQARLKKDSFTFEDFLVQIRTMKKMGPMDKLLEMLPGMQQVPDKVRSQLSGGKTADELKRTEALILSMTPKERRRPSIIDARRRKRIARGAGLEVRHLNELLKKFEMTRKMMKRMKKGQKGLPRLG